MTSNLKWPRKCICRQFLQNILPKIYNGVLIIIWIVLEVLPLLHLWTSTKFLCNGETFDKKVQIEVLIRKTSVQGSEIWKKYKKRMKHFSPKNYEHPSLQDNKLILIYKKCIALSDNRSLNSILTIL